MQLFRGVRVVLGTAGLAALLVVSGTAAQAAGPPGWRVVFRHHGPGSFSLYRAVTAAGQNAWAVGDAGEAGSGSPIAAYWHDGKWAVTRMPANLLGGLAAVSADGPRDAWAVDEFSVLHWHGGKWTVSKSWKITPPPGPLVSGITALSPTNVWVFGARTRFFEGRGTWHLQGRHWTHVLGTARHIATASAVTGGSMWAIGRTSASNDSIFHYVGGTWRHVMNAALNGLQFGAIYAQSASSVWVTANPAGTTTGSRLLHLRGTRWTSIALPWKLPLVSVAPDGLGSMSPDGHGGVWITAGFSQIPSWLFHFRAGHWSRVRIGASTVLGLAHLPHSTSMLGVGESAQRQRTGSDSLIWAFGRLP